MSCRKLWKLDYVTSCYALGMNITRPYILRISTSYIHIHGIHIGTVVTNWYFN